TKWEAQIVKYAALTGLSTGGSKVQEYLKTLAQADQDRLRNAQRGLEKGAHRASAAPHAPNARAAGIAAVLDVGQALLKGRQLQVRQDARTASEMVGNLLQGIGSVADWRAKAYEETVFRGVKGVDIFRTKPMQDSLDSLQAMKLKGLRVMAFKFLLPAAMVAAFWDGVDARASWQRSRFWLSAVQAAGVLGTAFTIAGTGVATFVGAGTILGFSGMVVAAILGLIGALLTLASVVTVMLLKEDDWVTWLRDNPLNNQRRGKKPIHDDLKDTLQKLANAQAAAA
ncbi:MAG: hypothetical protein JSR41_00895, partial [Proteobacteria bacterium]|nr:hypothetical protein [Pseudomonadota bacterium]